MKVFCCLILVFAIFGASHGRNTPKFTERKSVRTPFFRRQRILEPLIVGGDPALIQDFPHHLGLLDLSFGGFVVVLKEKVCNCEIENYDTDIFVAQVTSVHDLPFPLPIVWNLEHQWDKSTCGVAQPVDLAEAEFSSSTNTLFILITIFLRLITTLLCFALT